MKLLIILGEGGHTKQMLNLVSLLKSSDGGAYELHYVVAREDDLSASHIQHPGLIYQMMRPRGKHTGKAGAAIRTVLAGMQAIGILLRVRPNAVVSAGPALAVPVSILGKLFGARLIYIESSSRISRPSLTGRILYRWADLFFVQWQQLQACYPRAIFAGRLV